MVNAATVPRRERLRRSPYCAVIFVINLAYYRVGRRKEHLDLQDYQKRGNFWRAANENFIDMCVLEWCKLIADPKGKQHWSRIASDPARFKTELLSHLGIDEAAFENEIEVIRKYRDKFLAHLDSDAVMNIPAWDIAKKAVSFYYAYVQHEAEPGELAGLLFDFDAGYAQCEEEEVRAIFEHNA